MPVYVYRNLTTGETFEVQQSISESAWTEHPETGDPVKRIVQPVGIAFKGSGFYVTDSRSTSKGAATKSAPSGGSEAQPAASGASAAGSSAAGSNTAGSSGSGSSAAGSSAGAGAASD